MRSLIPLSLISSHLGQAAMLSNRQEPLGSARVNLSVKTGTAKALASGFIYGWPDNGTDADTSIPDYLVTDINFIGSRAGGAQLPAPALGWAIGGVDGYVGRLESTISNYRTTRKYGGVFILLPHDLWGADGGLDDGIYPGDDGDWTQMELFYEQLISDLKTHDLLDGLVFDIWNEPEIDAFWKRPFEQYLEYYVRAHRIVREKLPDTLISGPSGAKTPNVNDEYWAQWLSRIAEDDAVPDIYSWHQIGAWSQEPDTTVSAFNVLLEKYSLPERPIDVNEYAWPEEQNPANTAWYISQLERHDLRSLRANWGSGGELHDFMGDLIFQNDEGEYAPNGEWYVYKYYAEMGGERVVTQASDDLTFDAFATVSEKGVKILAGTRSVKAAYEIHVSGLTALGLSDEGSVNVRQTEFTWGGKAMDTGAPVDLGISEYTYTGDVLSILVDLPTNETAFAYEIVL